MGRYKIVDENGIYFTTHTIVEWLPVFREREFRKGFVEKPEDWVYSSAHNYAVGDHSSLKIELFQMP